MSRRKSGQIVVSVWVIVFAVYLSLGATTNATAQSEAPDPFAGIEEMVVVGSSTGALLQDAAVAVTAFDQQDFDAIGVKDIGDLAQFTPNLEIRSPYASTNPTLFIRGVGLRDFNANSSGSVAVYNDGIYMNSPAGQLAQLFDTEGVEVLKGPQGTIYGRNASAGAILVRSRKPTGTFGSSFRVDYGRFNDREVEGAVEIPIIDDTLSVRIAGKWRERSGYIKNRCADESFSQPFSRAQRRTFTARVHDVCFRNNPGAVTTVTPIAQGGLGWIPGVTPDLPKKMGDIDIWAARGLIRWQPTDNVDILFNVHGGRNRSDSRTFQHTSVKIRPGTGEPEFGGTDVSSFYRDYDTLTFTTSGLSRSSPGFEPEQGDPFTGDYNFVGKDIVDLFGASMNAEVVFGNWTVTSILGYEYNKRDSVVDLDGSSAIGLEPNFRNTAWQASEDLRILWDGGEGLTWETGLYFLHEDLNVDNEFNLVTPTFITKQVYNQKTYYLSAFTNFVWEPAELVEFEAGIRWNIEHRTIELQALTFDRLIGQTGVGNRGSSESDFWADAPTGNIRATYKATEDVSFYLLYSVGYKRRISTVWSSSRTRIRVRTSWSRSTQNL